MKRHGKTARPSNDNRISVRLEPEMKDAINEILDKASVTDDTERCDVIRDMVKMALKLQSHVLVIKLGLLSDKELKWFSEQATSLSENCNRLANALRDMRSLDAYQELIAAEWSDTLRACRQAICTADQLAVDITTIVRLRSKPPAAAITALQQRIWKLTRMEAMATDGERSHTEERLALESYLQSVHSIADKPRSES